MATNSSTSSTTFSSTTETSSTTPYSLHPSHNPGALITPVILKGDNYSEWATEFWNSLQAKQKIGFLDGTTLKPSTNPDRSRQREIHDSGKNEKSSTTALYTSDRGRQGRRENGDSRSNRGRSKSKGRKVTCWYCKKEGHVKADCYARKKRMEQDSDGEAAIAISQVEPQNALTVTGDEARENWVIDSGCTHHMTCRRDWFIDF